MLIDVRVCARECVCACVRVCACVVLCVSIQVVVLVIACAPCVCVLGRGVSAPAESCFRPELIVRFSL